MVGAGAERVAKQPAVRTKIGGVTIAGAISCTAAVSTAVGGRIAVRAAGGVRKPTELASTGVHGVACARAVTTACGERVAGAAAVGAIEARLTDTRACAVIAVAVDARQVVAVVFTLQPAKAPLALTDASAVGAVAVVQAADLLLACARGACEAALARALGDVACARVVANATLESGTGDARAVRAPVAAGGGRARLQVQGAAAVAKNAHPRPATMVLAPAAARQRTARGAAVDVAAGGARRRIAGGVPSLACDGCRWTSGAGNTLGFRQRLVQAIEASAHAAAGAVLGKARDTLSSVLHAERGAVADVHSGAVGRAAEVRAADLQALVGLAAEATAIFACAARAATVMRLACGGAVRAAGAHIGAGLEAVPVSAVAARGGGADSARQARLRSRAPAAARIRCAALTSAQA